MSDLQANGRMGYDPSFHFAHGKRFNTDELIYLCKFYEYDGSRSVGFALGKTEATITKVFMQLRQNGKFYLYKRMSLEEWENQIYSS